MGITPDQVAAIAPDPGALAQGRKLAASKDWSGLGRSARAAWGECQGSALYQVRADLGDMATKCSCPSRKFPCKHGLGLLLLVADGRLADAAEPDWVADWLGMRAEKQAKREEKRDKPPAPPDADAAAKRAARRHERVLEGLDGLDLWMDDLVRAGFAAIPSERPSVFEQQAARLVDAQAPGLASRLRRADPGRWASLDTEDSTSKRLLGDLGRLALLSHAYRRVDALDPALAADVRQAVGFSVELDEVAATGERALDDWAVLGSFVEEDNHVRTQRTWLRGLSSGRDALVLQFAGGGAKYGETFVPGTRFAAELAYWRSAWPLRAMVVGERGDPGQLDGRVPGQPTLAAFLDSYAVALAKQPWIERMPCCLHDVTLGATPDWVADREGRECRLQARQYRALAMSGGRPVDVVGEWNDEWLRPLLFRIDGGPVVAETN